MAELDDLYHSDQYLGPETLIDLCFKLICDNLDIISIKDKHGHRILRKGLAFPAEICHKFIEHMQRSKKGGSDDWFINIFKDTTATRLKRVKITNCNLTDASVQILMKHKLTDLELTNCCDLTELSIEHVNANSENLRSLVFHGVSIALPIRLVADENSSNYYKRGYVFKTPNLRRLALGYVGIPEKEYSLLLAGLTNLTHLDLSNHFQGLNFEFYDQVPNLLSLTLYNVKVNVDPIAFVNNICHLKKLRHLDISQSNFIQGQFEHPNRILRRIVTGLPELVSLDIGGTNLAGRGVAERPLETVLEDLANNALCDIPGLASRINNPLQFLGLYGTAHTACKRHDIPAKVIAGDANEDQILIAAHVCMNNKQELLQKVLSDLYHVFRYENCQRMDQALHTVLEAMEKHSYHKHIQISGSATLFYIVKMKEKGDLVVGVRKRIISTLLTGMSLHRDEEIMMRNGCLALCQFRIPQDVMFNYETLVKVLLHSAKHAEPEGFVQRIGIYLLNSLACQVEGKEKCLLGKLGCVKTMLELVEYRVVSGIFDDVLEVAWSTMWNMTDETAINCQRFLDEKGMVLFLKCVEQYPGKEELLRNMMGLLGNVAEVSYLRVHLMQHQYVCVFANLLCSNSDGIEVSYNATGILAHMASDGVEAWTLDKPSRDEVLDYMVQAIERWDLSAERNINYRSFLPLLRLLDVYHTPECQHWAVWALANLTNVYPHKYCSLVIKEGGIEKLNALKVHQRPYERIKELATIVIENCCQDSSHSNDGNYLQAHSDAEYSLDG
ncbi:PREDICTED: protein zer-1 homolog [Polistes canadensis]|uniref:protein zer-1 homolog n=1 Tax=Polistes canadensis TaxID=91411 RepID=UPI000718D0E7|nr:PREDICTED: protein zer-1 homolog [Polistes canadensis]